MCQRRTSTQTATPCDERLSRCPLCDYDLCGLTEEYICPECGFAYDPHATAVRLPHWRHHLKGAVPNLGFLLALLIYVLAMGRTFLPEQVLLLLLAANVFALLAYWLRFRVVAPNAHVATNRKGIDLHLLNRPAKFIPWSQIGSANYSWISGIFRINDTSGAALVSQWYGRMGGPAVARRCVRMINDRKQRYLEYRPLESLAPPMNPAHLEGVEQQ